MKTHQSIFKGKILILNNGNWLTVGLKNDKNGFIIDLVDRVREVLMNISSYSHTMKIFFASEPTPYEKIEGNWQYELESNRMLHASKSSYEVQYYEDWHETKYTVDFSINRTDLFALFKSNIDRWVYIKLEIKTN